MLRSIIFCLSLCLAIYHSPLASAEEKMQATANQAEPTASSLNVDFANGREVLAQLQNLTAEALAGVIQGQDRVEVEAVRLQIKNLAIQLDNLEKMMYRTEANLRELVLRSIVHLDSESLLLGGAFIRTNLCPKLICEGTPSPDLVEGASPQISGDLPPLIDDQRENKHLLKEAQQQQEVSFDLSVPEQVLNEKQFSNYLNKVELLFYEKKTQAAQWLLENSVAKVPSEAKFAHELLNKLGMRLGKAKKDKAALTVFTTGQKWFAANPKVSQVFATNMLIQYIQLHDQAGFCRTKGLITNQKVGKNLARYYTYYQCDLEKEE